LFYEAKKVLLKRERMLKRVGEVYFMWKKEKREDVKIFAFCYKFKNFSILHCLIFLYIFKGNFRVFCFSFGKAFSLIFFLFYDEKKFLFPVEKKV
jgi:hypothetical protein